MQTIAKLSLASVLVLLIGASVQAQSSKQGDYYSPTQTPQQQATPGQEQRIQQGDFYKPAATVPQGESPAQQQQNHQGDYYKPSK
jgi:hypothetical protein